MEAKIRLVHNPRTTFEVVKEATIYAPLEMVYIMTDNSSFLTLAKNLYNAEKEKNEWIRAYQNVLNGLNYWKDRALTK